MPRRRTKLGSAALVLLYGGVAPVEPVLEPCQRALLHSPPAVEGEWKAATFAIESMRVHRWGEHGWIQLRGKKLSLRPNGERPAP